MSEEVKFYGNAENGDLKITENGEITYNREDMEYTVWDETYAFTVGITSYPKVAHAMLEAYGKHYLGEDNVKVENERG